MGSRAIARQDRPRDFEFSSRPQGQNVSNAERVASLVGGASLVAAGLARRSSPGLAVALTATGMICRGVTGKSLLYRWLGINRSDTRDYVGVRAGQGFRFETAVTIERPIDDLYQAWHDFERLPALMQHLVSVNASGAGKSHWVAEGPFGKRLEWDAEIVTDKQNEIIAWQSLPGGDVDTAGSVRFERAAGDRGTILRVELKYDPPGGKIGATIAKLMGAGLERRCREDVRRFKQIMEAGEVPTTEGQPQGSCGCEEV